VSDPTRPLDVEACTQQSPEVQFTATG